MNRQVLIVAVGALFFGFLGACVLALTGCGASLPSPSDQAAVAAYEAEQLACVIEAGARIDADRCRCAVHQKWGRGCTTLSLGGPRDGGVE